jgi:hypothetical protein
MDLDRLAEVAPRLFAVVAQPQRDGPDVPPRVVAWGLWFGGEVWFRWSAPPAWRSAYSVTDTVAHALDDIADAYGPVRLAWLAASTTARPN